MNQFKQGLPETTWDEHQKLRDAHMLQGREWAQFQQALGRQIVWSDSDRWSWMAVVIKGKGVRYLYVPYGPTVSDPDSLADALLSLKTAAKTLNLDFIRCEPIGVLMEKIASSGLRRVKSVQPQESLVVDLKQTPEILRSQLSSSHRNTINGAERRGLILRSSTNMDDLESFLNLIHATANTRHFHSYPDSYYRTLAETLLPIGKAKFFIAEYQGKAVSATLCMDYLQTRAYSYTGNDPDARNLRATAPLVWKMIIDSKAEGFERFDLWGIAPTGAGPNHPWAGFSEFKRSFGGQEVFYSGTWELPISHLKYHVHKIAKRVSKLV
ncbi:MAG TPA: peptidoglycan bridge formation glycyltransferase FemA/FemB family protein [Candidatus Dormibacteraeota bacterium]|nr:peptidoglycan bridge formation glycyltransferase FemA/FemB family protein [Candidatus Dormibacteraeota bacterium]